MAEGSQETEDQSVQVPRASTAPALPAIITTTTTVRSRKDGQRNDDNSFTNDNPSVATPGLLRTSQSFPVGSVVSDNASGSSANQQDSKRNARSPIQSNTYGRNSISSPTLYGPSADSSAIDPLSQVSFFAFPTLQCNVMQSKSIEDLCATGELSISLSAPIPNDRFL